MFLSELAQRPAAFGREAGDFRARIVTRVGAQPAFVPAVFEREDLGFAHPGERGERGLEPGGRREDFGPESARRAHASGQRLGRVRGGDAPPVDDEHPAASHFDFGQDVGREQDGVAFAEVFDQLADLPDLVRVEADGRFVEDEQVGVVQEGIGQAHALAVAFGQRADQFPLHIAQSAEFLHGIDALAVGAAPDAFERGPVFEVFLHAHLRVKRDVFRHVTDAGTHLARLAGHVETGHAGPPAGGRQVTGQDPHGRALARAVGPEETDNFPLLDGEIEIADGCDAGVFFGQSCNLDHDTGPLPPPGPG